MTPPSEPVETGESGATEPGEAYYIEYGWSGCAGSAWGTLSSAVKDGWVHAERNLNSAVAEWKRRARIERYLDAVLGTEEEDGSGAGLLGDVMLAVKRAWDQGYASGVSAPANRALGLGNPTNPYSPTPPAGEVAP